MATGTSKKILRIGGMSCASCSAAVEKALRDIPGVADAAPGAELASGSVTANGEGPSG